MLCSTLRASWVGTHLRQLSVFQQAASSGTVLIRVKINTVQHVPTNIPAGGANLTRMRRRRTLQSHEQEFELVLHSGTVAKKQIKLSSKTCRVRTRPKVSIIKYSAKQTKNEKRRDVATQSLSANSIELCFTVTCIYS